MSKMDPEFRPELDDESPADTIVECEHCGREYDLADEEPCPHCADDAEQWADFLKEEVAEP